MPQDGEHAPIRSAIYGGHTSPRWRKRVFLAWVITVVVIVGGIGGGIYTMFPKFSRELITLASCSVIAVGCVPASERVLPPNSPTGIEMVIGGGGAGTPPPEEPQPPPPQNGKSAGPLPAVLPPPEGERGAVARPEPLMLAVAAPKLSPEVERLLGKCREVEQKGKGENLRFQDRGKNYFCWKHVGARPYTGGAREALASSGWPVKVQQAFLQKIDKSEKEDVKIRAGAEFQWMTYGRLLNSRARTEHNVIAYWGPDEEYDAQVYTVQEGNTKYRLTHVDVCDNWNGTTEKLPAPPAPKVPLVAKREAPAGTTRERGVQPGRCELYTVRLHVWNLASFPPEFRQKFENLHAAEGRQLSFTTGASVSRSLGPRDLFERGEIRRIRTSVRVAFSVINQHATEVRNERALGEKVISTGYVDQTISAVDVAAGKMLRVVFPDNDVLSPPIPKAAENAKKPWRELRIFSSEWPRYPVCSGNMHAVAVVRVPV